jgi:DNA-binding NtrC family response regulator
VPSRSHQAPALKPVRPLQRNGAMDPERIDAGGPPQLAETFERFLAHAESESGDLSLRDWVDLAEAWRIERALRETRGNRSAAARKLGIGRRTLYAKMHKLGL